MGMRISVLIGVEALETAELYRIFGKTMPLRPGVGSCTATFVLSADGCKRKPTAVGKGQAGAMGAAPAWPDLLRPLRRGSRD